MRELVGALRRSPLLLAGVVIVALVVAVAALAPLIAPYDPREISPTSLAPPSSQHLLGTNDSGADIFSRLVWGSRTSLLVAAGATSLLMVIGVTVGLTAGLRGGLVDTFLMRLVDVFLAMPVIPVLIFVSALVTPALLLSIVLIGVTAWPEVARIVRSQTLSLRTRGFVHSARGFGGGPLYVMRRHLVPALGPVLAVNAVQMAGVVVGIEAGLAFLGLGDPAAVSWGQEIERALEHQSILIGSLWVWWVLPSSAALTLTLFGLLLIGVGLEPWFNPRTRPAAWASRASKRRPRRPRQLQSAS